jgi:hypothetical protein
MDQAPVVVQYGPNAVYCVIEGKKNSVGCAVASTASVMQRYGVKPPMVGNEVDLQTLGASMGRRCREVSPKLKHGVCPKKWCTQCSYLELKARGIAVNRKALTWEQILAHASNGRPVVMPLTYGFFPVVSPRSYSSSVPARGRSDRYEGGHMVVLHDVRGNVGIVADPDFGSPARPRVPPHSEIPLATLKRGWEHLGSHPVTYALQASEGLVPPPPPPPNGGRAAAAATVTGPALRFGGQPKGRGRFRVKTRSRIRRSPHVRDDNLIRVVNAGTTFACGQTTFAGTNVGGSPKWLGTADGKNWIHSSLVEHVGERNGTEDIR